MAITRETPDAIYYDAGGGDNWAQLLAMILPRLMGQLQQQGYEKNRREANATKLYTDLMQLPPEIQAALQQDEGYMRMLSRQGVPVDFTNTAFDPNLPPDHFKMAKDMMPAGMAGYAPPPTETATGLVDPQGQPPDWPLFPPRANLPEEQLQLDNLRASIASRQATQANQQAQAGREMFGFNEDRLNAESQTLIDTWIRNPASSPESTGAALSAWMRLYPDKLEDFARLLAMRTGQVVDGGTLEEGQQWGNQEVITNLINQFDWSPQQTFEQAMRERQKVTQGLINDQYTLQTANCVGNYVAGLMMGNVPRDEGGNVVDDQVCMASDPHYLAMKQNGLPNPQPLSRFYQDFQTAAAAETRARQNHTLEATKQLQVIANLGQEEGAFCEACTSLQAYVYSQAVASGAGASTAAIGAWTQQAYDKGDLPISEEEWKDGNWLATWLANREETQKKRQQINSLALTAAQLTAERDAGQDRKGLAVIQDLGDVMSQCSSLESGSVERTACQETVLPTLMMHMEDYKKRIDMMYPQGGAMPDIESKNFILGLLTNFIYGQQRGVNMLLSPGEKIPLDAYESAGGPLDTLQLGPEYASQYESFRQSIDAGGVTPAALDRFRSSMWTPDDDWKTLDVDASKQFLKAAEGAGILTPGVLQGLNLPTTANGEWTGEIPDGYLTPLLPTLAGRSNPISLEGIEGTLNRLLLDSQAELAKGNPASTDEFLGEFVGTLETIASNVGTNQAQKDLINELTSLTIQIGKGELPFLVLPMILARKTGRRIGPGEDGSYALYPEPEMLDTLLSILGEIGRNAIPQSFGAGMSGSVRMPPGPPTTGR
jgi:hypothetical protein